MAFDSNTACRLRLEGCPRTSVGGVSAPGPIKLGRSVVVDPNVDVPPAWAECDRIRIGQDLIVDPVQLLVTVNDVQRRYVQRIPTVFELSVADNELRALESTDSPPFELGATFTFLRERLVKVVWHNSYDARIDPPIWWWSRKAAARLQVSLDGPADVRLSDGSPAWIDGGPRQAFDLTETVIHHESVELGLMTPLPPESVI